jgi:peptidoglycan hydrolase-like protein with peptidoglycan-binding domain
MVGITVPPSGETRFVLIRQMAQTHCLVQLRQEYTVPLESITNNWFGEAHLFWKDFEQIGSLLSVGSVGKSVEKLQDLLANVGQHADGAPLLGELGGRHTQFFGQRTQKAVARFQHMQRLVADGIVGPRTLILLYKGLPEYTPPSLSSIGGAASPRSPHNGVATGKGDKRADASRTAHGEGES